MNEWIKFFVVFTIGGSWVVMTVVFIKVIILVHQGGSE